MRIKYRRNAPSTFFIFGVIGFVCYFLVFHKGFEFVLYNLRHVLRTKLIPVICHDTCESLIQADLAKQVVGLGDNGVPALLEGEAKVIGENDFLSVGLNKELSDHLTYNRSTPDSRNPLCQNIEYDRDSLPMASVVIIFHNEPQSLLLRTVHSVLNTTDRRNMNEIIFVDDASTNDELKDKLDYYVLTRMPQDIIKIIRLKYRSGLIRARLAGAQEAHNDVLVFLDAHCECVVNWLEPLIERIQESPTTVVLPVVDIIDSKDFRFQNIADDNRHVTIGGFTWQAQFRWINVPNREIVRQTEECSKELEICPTRSPTMCGGIFAISRVYFWESGSYDDQMDGWGGENLEMSFRIWQCGGSIETIPCSRIGHVFRAFRPYSLPDDIKNINSARMASVWMDDYIYMFHLEYPGLKNNSNIGDLTERQNLRRNLQCKGFDWYMKNVYPEKFDPINNVVAYGRVEANSSNLCLDTLHKDTSKPFHLALFPCDKPSVTKSQFFALRNSGVFRTDRGCASVKFNETAPYLVVMDPCYNQDVNCDKWNYSDSQIRHLDTNMCLDHEGLTKRDHIRVTNCDPNKMTQKWRIEP